MLSAFMGPVTASADGPVVITAAYGGFTPANIGSYQLNGDAFLYDGSTVRLTPPEGSQSGSMFWKQRIALDDNGSFSTQFSFRISEPDSSGADGLTFCIQPGTSNVVSDGGGLGFAGIPDSLGIEFDTYHNDEFGDPNGNHVGIDLNGDVESVLTADAPFTLEDGSIGYAWVEYDGAAQMLYVRVSDTNVRPTDALLEYGVDLAAVYGDAAYCGFTGATGGSYAAHDILGWYFLNRYELAGLDPATIEYVMGPATIDAVADPQAVEMGGTSDVTFTVRDAEAAALAGQILTITAPVGGTVSAPTVTTDANGEGVVTFTAPDADIFCRVLATAEGGLQGEAVITVGDAKPPYYSSVTSTTRASVDADDNEGVDEYEEYRGSRTPAISADGRYVVFYSGNSFVSDDKNYERDWYRKDLETGAIELVSADSEGVVSEYGESSSISNDDGTAAVSGDGRYVVFDSYSDTLDGDDTNGSKDVFMRDMVEGTTVRVSENADGSDGTAGEGGTYGSRSPVISRDGRYVVFYTGNAFVEEDTNDVQDWYRKDMTTGDFELVSVADDGTLSDNGGGSDYDRAAISADGRYVAFDTWANTMVDNDTNDYRDVFVRDMTEGTILPVSFDAEAGNESWNYGSRTPAISADGRYVAFISGNDYAGEDTNDNTTDWYLRDMTDGSLELLSVNMDGESGDDGMWSNDGRASVSDDGRYVAFVSRASDLTLGDTNDQPDVFVRDRDLGVTGVVSVSSDLEYSNGWQQNCAMSADGMVVAYDSWADNLVEDDANDTADIFVSYLAESEPEPSDLTQIPLEGKDRYDTAIEISQDAFPGGADAVVIATGENWPDALGGSALAGVIDGPVLLSGRGALPASVLGEIDRLGASEAYVLGDFRALSTNVYNALVAELGFGNVHRIGGANRYETANLVAAEVVDMLGDEYDGTAFVGTGLNFADALAASPLAAANGWPVYLSGMPTISSDTIAAMQAAGVTDTILLGGEAAMPEGTSIVILGAGFTAIRIDGADRYETAAKVAEWGVTDAGLDWDGVAIATGEKFPDALSGGVAQGISGSVLLLSRSDSLSPVTQAALEDNAGDIASVRFLGGLPALSQSVRDAVMAALAP